MKPSSLVAARAVLLLLSCRVWRVPAGPNPAAVSNPVYRTGRFERCDCGTGLHGLRVWPEGDESQAVNLTGATGDLAWLVWRNRTAVVQWMCDGMAAPRRAAFFQSVSYWSAQLSANQASEGSCTAGAGQLVLDGWDEGPHPTSLVYIAGEGGYVCTAKIPVLLRTVSGVLLAFAEARRGSCSDSAPTDLVVKRSEDGGRSWSRLAVVRSDSSGGTHVIGNAAPVQLAVSSPHPGRILLPHCRDNLEVWLTYSDDDGLTWAKPTLMPGVVQPDWRWVGTGPPGALQLRSGRVLVPAYHGKIRAGVLNNIVHGHVMLSDDGGDTWRLAAAGGYTSWAPLDLNENQAVELKNGSVLLNGRSLATLTPQRRVQVRSDDGGETWSKPQYVNLPQPINGCEGSVVSTNVGNPPALLFSGPDSHLFRDHMQLWVSLNEGDSWRRLGEPIDVGPSGYSSLQMDCDGRGLAGSRCDALLLYETSDLRHEVPVQQPQRQVFRRVPFSLSAVGAAVSAAAGAAAGVLGV